MEEISVADVLAAVVEAGHRLTLDETPTPNLGIDNLDTAAPDFPHQVLAAIAGHYGTTSPHELARMGAAAVHVHAAEQLRDSVHPVGVNH